MSNFFCFAPLRSYIPSPRAFIVLCVFGLMAPHPCFPKDEGGGEKPSTGALRAASPDVVIELLDSDDESVETLGENFFNDDAHQTSSSFVLVGHMKSYLIHVKNTGERAATFQINFNGLLSPSGAATAWNAAGWAAHATPKDSAEEILSPLQSAQGWTTPSVPAGEETVAAIPCHSKFTSSRAMPSSHTINPDDSSNPNHDLSPGRSGQRHR